MADPSIWDGAPPDLDRRIRIARELLDLVERWDRESHSEDTDAYAGEALRRCSEELRDVVRRDVL